jgi:hypothetical protein
MSRLLVVPLRVGLIIHRPGDGENIAFLGGHDRVGSVGVVVWVATASPASSCSRSSSSRHAQVTPFRVDDVLGPICSFVPPCPLGPLFSRDEPGTSDRLAFLPLHQTALSRCHSDAVAVVLPCPALLFTLFLDVSHSPLPLRHRTTWFSTPRAAVCAQYEWKSNQIGRLDWLQSSFSAPVVGCSARNMLRAEARNNSNHNHNHDRSAWSK